MTTELQKWVQYPGPGQFRGEGPWLKIEDVPMTEGEWRRVKEIEYLPTHEGDEPPEDALP